MFGCAVSLETSSGLILFSTVKTYNNFRLILQNKTKVKNISDKEVSFFKTFKDKERESGISIRSCWSLDKTLE